MTFQVQTWQPGGHDQLYISLCERAGGNSVQTDHKGHGDGMMHTGVKDGAYSFSDGMELAELASEMNG